mmetsp:Transcript_4567/g.6760  ORF Transcript_4567/g.6760 Transcript_4567/m.6760 type:complete len:131 (+) Transcript_4567:334-726(+)
MCTIRVRHLKQPWCNLPVEEQAFWMQFQHTRRSDDTVFLEMGDPTRQIPDELVPTLDLDFWIDKADFYDLDHMPGLFYYDSWDQLQEILSNGSLSETPPARSLASRQLRVEKILDMWRPLILSKFPLLKT